MKNYFTIFLILFLLSPSIYAANGGGKKFEISGKVVDAKSHDALEYATVTVFDEDQEVVSGSITDTEGKFSIRLQAGNYSLEIRYISYLSITRDVDLKADVNLEEIALSPDAVMLDGVEIVDEKTQVEYKLDKKVYNIGKDITAQGGTVNDALENIPSVAVDASGAISLRGNGGVQVLVNGKPSMMTMNNGLAGIPVQNVEKIEVVTNPSARYEAAGTAGIINIVLKKNKLKGVGGSVQLTTGLPADHSATANLNYKNEKFNLFGSFGRRYSNFKGAQSNSQSVTIGQETTGLEQLGTQDRNDNAFNYFLGTEIFFNPHNSFTASFFHYDIKNTDYTSLNYDYDRGLSFADSAVTRSIDYYEPQKYNQLEAKYAHTFKQPGKKWTVDFQYDFWNDDENALIQNGIVGAGAVGQTQFRTRDIESSDDFLLQSDLVMPVWEEGRLEFGFRAETRVISSKYIAEEMISESWEVYNGLDNDIDYSERIGGLYAQYGNTLGKFNYLMGLRTEYTEIAIDDVADLFSTEKKYLRLFPTAHLNYEFSKTTKLQLSYSRRIRRPGFWQLNPFGGIGDNNSIFAGNPDLDPAFTHGFELGAVKNFKKLSLNPSLYFQQTSNFFQAYVQQTEAGGFFTMPINLDIENRFGAEFLANYRMTKWLQLTGEFNYYQFQQNGSFDGQSFDFSNNAWTAEFGTRLRLPKSFTFQGSFEYRGRSQNAQTLTRAIYVANLGLSKRLLKDKASLSFNVRNLLDSQKQVRLTTGQGFSTEMMQKRIGRRFRLTFSYQFNRQKNERDRQPGRSNR